MNGSGSSESSPSSILKRQIIGYYLLWRDDVHGAWLPFTNATDEEIVWVGYDSTGAPTDVWTYWHGKILHADWRDRGTVTIDVQWGKHGSLPRGITDEDAMWPRTIEQLLGLVVGRAPRHLARPPDAARAAVLLPRLPSGT